ncbi:UDP-N-acetylmuramoyl-L-alanyl-D-glutamate--2,6-diaminopimelate ligase [Bacillus lacus]|uniref:UDP-N-acetylmuramyl-tripeptide synthetase n=1 Tax=Metabacillus lacus TaxID=1983721 RepID=A0A7X2IYD6_9BACI|nr:UDP-N-acetylmuramoyl-L-alanyl-D-glutamate--2,6-diaminopimelate ligase [Metabacillus lacus]MRX72075.1 UDP-N-acetylmuramoyl-L-alanyl-D-glutamate--2,6-diaminopimelate ligase [Metabacillus lacus]
MKITELLGDISGIQAVAGQTEGVSALGISSNSKNLKAGDAFVAIAGHSADGHDYIHSAVANGASLVIGERSLNNLPVPYIQVDNSRKVFAQLASSFAGHPSRDLKMIGITGTNGKTTTSYMVKHILESAGYSCALFGSVVNTINGQEYPSAHTTPDPLELNSLLKSSNDDFVIMEVSSHGISQHRIEGIQFDYCLFTNLDHDHLDYHNGIEDYFYTKAKLFDQLKKHGKAVINTDSNWGRRLAEIVESKGRTVQEFGENESAPLRLLHVEESMKPSARILDEGQILSLQMLLPGRYNVCNALGAYALGKEAGLRPEEMISSLKRLSNIPGRFEVVHLPKNITAIVDYAHTADALSNCLRTAKACGANSVHHVFGFRGNRDATKRSEMIRTSAQISDQYILTLDDLNGVPSDTMEIELNRLQHTFGNEKGRVLPDRTLAIQKAIAEAEEGDWVVITGKGIEPYQDSYQLRTDNDKDTVSFLCNMRNSEEHGLYYH